MSIGQEPGIERTLGQILANIDESQRQHTGLLGEFRELRDDVEEMMGEMRLLTGDKGRIANIESRLDDLEGRGRARIFLIGGGATVLTAIVEALRLGVKKLGWDI